MHAMRRRAVLKTFLVLTAATGLLAPPSVRAADPRSVSTTHALAPNATAAAGATSSEPVVVDVALDGAGQLTGVVVGPTGESVPRATVSVLRQGGMVATCPTDASGRFTTAHLSGGVYDVRWSDGGAVCRLWAPETAPPSAKPNLLLTPNAQVVRAQSSGLKPLGGFLKGPIPWIAFGTVVAGLITWDVVKEQHDRFRRDHPPAS
jgi:hypothetical protein